MAWHNPDDKAIIDIWNFVYDEELHIEDGDFECDRYLVAKTLVGVLSSVERTLTLCHYPDQTRHLNLAPQVC